MGISAMVAMAGASIGSTVAGHMTRPKQPDTPAPPIPNPADDEKNAQSAAKKRRDLYANVGRSSTILTGPDGLQAPPADSATPKALLGL